MDLLSEFFSNKYITTCSRSGGDGLMVHRRPFSDAGTEAKGGGGGSSRLTASKNNSALFQSLLIFLL
jgi:hypothetical protein